MKYSEGGELYLVGQEVSESTVKRPADLNLCISSAKLLDSERGWGGHTVVAFLGAGTIGLEGASMGIFIAFFRLSQGFRISPSCSS